MRGQGFPPQPPSSASSTRERDDAEELRNLLRSADQLSRAKHNVPQPPPSASSISSGISGIPISASAPSSGFVGLERDRQANELASLLGSIDAGLVSNRPNTSNPAPTSASGIPPRPSYSSLPPSTASSIGAVSAAELRDKDLRNMPGSGISGASVNVQGLASLGGNPSGFGSTYRRPDDYGTTSDSGVRRSYEFSNTYTASSTTGGGGGGDRGGDASGFYSDDFSSDPTSSVDYNGRRNAPGPADIIDFTVVRFNRDYAVRGRLGKYLTTVLDESSAPGSENTANSQQGSKPGATTGPGSKGMFANTNVNAGKTFLLGVNGQGIGEDVDCINFINVENNNNKEAEAPIKYGQVIAIKSPFSKERLLGLRDGNKLGFWRHVIGQGEKWQILKAHTGITGGAGGNTLLTNATHASHGNGSGYLGTEDLSSRGKYVRVGDTILLQTFKSDHFLSIHESGSTSNSVEPKLIYKERTGLGTELWQIEVFGSVPLPSWCQNRPYLSGKYLAMPSTLRNPAPEVEARTFPRSQTNPFTLPHSSSTTTNTNPTGLDSTQPLNEFSLPEQHYVFMRELLLVMSGVEGNYIRVAAVPTSTGPSSTGGPSPSLPRLNDIRLVIDIDQADKSTASQVSSLLTLCESMIRIRDFIRQQQRYEYGLVSHALASAIKVIIRDFDVLMCQMEFLLNTGRLSLQKMVFLLQPSKQTITVLERLTVSLRELNGGQLLNCLYLSSLEQGDSKAKEIYDHLLNKASEPFLKMLSLWIFRGELHDPYKEFMVAEDASITKEALQEDFNAQYWDNRYSLDPKHVPRFLSNHAMKALTAGKYLNVVRDCLGDYVVVTNTLNTQRNHNHPNGSNADTTSAATPNTTGIILPAEQFLSLSLDHSDSLSLLTKAIEDAYQFSSQALLRLLEAGTSPTGVVDRDGGQTSHTGIGGQTGLHSHLSSLSRFFLLEHGDFFIQFMDTAEEELRREVKDIPISRVKALLTMAVQSSTLATDPHREELTCSLASHNLIQHLHLIQMAGESSVGNNTAPSGMGTTSTSYAEMYSSLSSQALKGIEAFTLDYKVQWPMSIVLSRRAITKYQLLSRLLYFSKHVERRLLSGWMAHQCTKQYTTFRSRDGRTDGPASMASRWFFSTSYTLRHRMLHFIQNFVYYITLEVIHPRSHELQYEIINNVNDMDQVLELHEKFLDTCLKECLLASQELLKVLTKLMTTCLLFADYMTKLLQDCVNQDNSDGDGSRSSNSDERERERENLRASKAAASKDPNQKSNVTAKEAEKFKALVQSRRNKIEHISEVLEHETSHESFGRILTKFTKTFDEQLKEFLDNLWTNSYRHHAQLANLCVRLDYNGFYSNQFASGQL